MGRANASALALLCVLPLAASCTAAPPPPAPRPAAPSSSATEPQRSATPVRGTPGSAGAGDPYYPDDGNGGYDVREYNLAISYDPPARRLSGTATITARATQNLSRFNLDLHKLTVRGVAVNGEPARFARRGEHELVITPPADLARGATFRTEVRYGGVPQTISDVAFGDNGWTITPSGGAFVAGQPHGASTWFPVNDHPSDKARFRLSARVPSEWGVVSNGVPVGKRSNGGWTTYRWASKHPMASYLATVGIDKWRYVERKLPDGTPVLDAYAPGSEAFRPAEDQLPEVLRFLESRFGDYPMESAGAIALGQTIGYSLEIQTRPIYSTGVGVETVVHENAHQWFGDAVSVARWRDICLNECLASYAEDLWAEAKQGVDLDAQYRARLADTDWSGRLYDMGAGNEFGAVYTKGKVALHALRRQVGDRVFFSGLRSFLREHRNGNASWPQFEQVMQRKSGQDLDGFFRAWFRSDVRPAEEYLYPGSL